jgi:hypothetical protein
VEIQMPRAKPEAAVRRDRLFIAQHAVVVTEYFQRAGLLRLTTRRIVAASGQNDVAIVRHRQYLMRKNPGLDAIRLRHLGAWRGVVVDMINPDVRWIVEGNQYVARRDIGRHVDWPVR